MRKKTNKFIAKRNFLILCGKKKILKISKKDFKNIKIYCRKDDITNYESINVSNDEDIAKKRIFNVMRFFPF